MVILKIALPNVEMTDTLQKVTISVPAKKLGPESLLEIFDGMEAQGFLDIMTKGLKFYFDKKFDGCSVMIVISESQVLKAI